MDEKILKRIQKLLALAGDNPDSPESKSAANKAAELMAAHNIGYEDVNDDGTVDDSNMEEVAVTANATHHQIWESSLAHVLCEVFDCKRIIMSNGRGRGGTRTFIGTKSDVSILVWFYKYLRLRIAKQAEKKFNLQRDQKEFGLGAVDALSPRLREMYERKKEVVVAACTDIMVIGKALAVNNYFDAKYGNARTKKYGGMSGSRTARAAGIAAGNSMSINQQTK